MCGKSPQAFVKFYNMAMKAINIVFLFFEGMVINVVVGWSAYEEETRSTKEGKNIYIFKIVVYLLTFGGDQLFWQRGNTSSFCAQ
jgi:hypothetical protein